MCVLKNFLHTLTKKMWTIYVLSFLSYFSKHTTLKINTLEHCFSKFIIGCNQRGKLQSKKAKYKSHEYAYLANASAHLFPPLPLNLNDNFKCLLGPNIMSTKDFSLNQGREDHEPNVLIGIENKQNKGEDLSHVRQQVQLPRSTGPTGQLILCHNSQTF